MNTNKQQSIAGGPETAGDAVDTALRSYVEREILPRYDHHDAAHRRNHVEAVVAQSLELAAALRTQGHDIDINMAYAIAAYHDTGLCEGRDMHHLASGRIIRSDIELRRWFSEEQIEVMAQAAEDHRASATTPPRSIYGRIVADADRIIIPEVIVRRCVQYGVEHYPDLDAEGHCRRAIEHLRDKYAPGGYMHLWFAEGRNAKRLAELHTLLADDDALHALVRRCLDEELPQANGD